MNREKSVPSISHKFGKRNGTLVSSPLLSVPESFQSFYSGLLCALKKKKEFLMK